MHYLGLSIMVSGDLSMPLIAVVIVGCLIPNAESARFPVDGCSTDDIDMLCLYFQHHQFPVQAYQKTLCQRMFSDLAKFANNKTASRMMFAEIYDRFSAHGVELNISSWSLNTLIRPKPYGVDYQPTPKRKYKKVESLIEAKRAFVKELFSGMSGARENVTHIAIVFLDGIDLSYDEQRRIPFILEQQNMDTKMFVVIRGALDDSVITLLNDTLLAPRDSSLFSHHILTLAICHQCMEGWLAFPHTHSSDSLSCYKLLKATPPVDWSRAKSNCQSEHGAILASIETEEELTFTQEHLAGHFTELWSRMNETGDSSATFKVNIGLNKRFGNITLRFQWQFQSRPMVLSNWLPGKPSGGYNSTCTVWEFTRVDNLHDKTNSSTLLVDGWADVGCWNILTSFSFCEAVLPRRIDGANLMWRQPASNESFHRALVKGDLLQYQDNLVSASAQIGNADFFKYLEQKYNVRIPVFDCGIDAGNPRYISYLFVCDYIDHCRNKRDELHCLINPLSVLPDRDRCVQRCSGVYCCDGSCLPVQWVNDGQVDCQVCDYSAGNETNDEAKILNKYLKRNETCAFVCNNDVCVHDYELNDGVADCTGSEGPIDEILGKLSTAESCYNIMNQSIWAPMCVYVRDSYGNMMGCRDLSHLQNCRVFACPNGYFKCPNTYCIPQHYVLNGLLDCPTGEDEIQDLIGQCHGSFACWNSRICLHPDLVCDGHTDCPNQDDENACGMSSNQGFHSISGALIVSTYNRSVPLRIIFEDKRIRYVDLSGLDLSAALLWPLYDLKNGAFIKMSNCKVQSLFDTFNYISRAIQELDLSYNQLQTLDGVDTDFSALENIRLLNVSFNAELSVVRNLQFQFLETLDLSHTTLSELDESFLVSLPNLRRLDVSFTFIVHLHKTLFPSPFLMQTLDLRGLTISNSREDFFNGLSVNQDLYTDSFELCCPQIRGRNIPYHTCHAPDDAISSCFDLVGSNVQRILLWVFAVLAVLGNIAVIVYRMLWGQSNLRTGYGIFVTSLGISDFVMGLYLFIIAGADYYYRDVYVLHERFWKNSTACRLAGFLATLSSEASISFISLITLDRYLVMKYPFGELKFSQRSATIVVFVLCILWCIIALFPAVFQFEMYSASAMCLGLPLTTKRLSGWEFSFSVFIVFNLCLCLVIAFGQRAVFRAMSENRMAKDSVSTSPRRIEDILVAKQLSLVALSNFFCWFPIGIMGLMSFGLYEIGSDAYAWTTVVILPINSAANPFLYTIPALMTKWEHFKERHKKSASTTRVTSISK